MATSNEPSSSGRGSPLRTAQPCNITASTWGRPRDAETRTAWHASANVEHAAGAGRRELSGGLSTTMATPLATRGLPEYEICELPNLYPPTSIIPATVRRMLAAQPNVPNREAIDRPRSTIPRSLFALHVEAKEQLEPCGTNS